MDKKINRIKTATKKLVKEESELLKMDKKQDKIVDKAKKIVERKHK